MKAALQMYTVRDCIKDKDSFFIALEKIKQLGYDGVEFAGFYGASALELANKLTELSLTPVCCHVDKKALEDLSDTLSFLKVIGCKAIALAWSETSSQEQIKSTCALLKQAKEQADAAGVALYYHNHNHEFEELDGKLPIDEIKDCCKLELDTFWCFAAGHNSARYLAEHNNSIGLIHLKDGVKATKYPCALGEGENDITGIVKAAQELGYEWLIVENDNPVPTGMEDVERSINYLHKLI